MNTALGGEPQKNTSTPPPQGAPPPEKKESAAPPQQQSNNNSAPDWRASLPDDMKEEQALKIIHDIPSLAKSYLHAQKMIGADKVPVPSKHWTDDDWQNFYDKIGRPAPDKYEVALPKETKFIDEEWVKELKPMAHKLGVMPKQLEKIIEWYESKATGAESALNEAKTKEIEAGLGNLKKEWGQAYEQKISFAKNVLKDHASEELIDMINKDPSIGSNPHIIKLLNKVGEILYKEGDIPEGGPGSGKHTPEEALRMANLIMADPSHAYNNKDHANHKHAVNEVNELMAMAYPSNQENP